MRTVFRKPLMKFVEGLEGELLSRLPLHSDGSLFCALKVVLVKVFKINPAGKGDPGDFIDVRVE